VDLEAEQAAVAFFGAQDGGAGRVAEEDGAVAEA